MFNIDRELELITGDSLLTLDRVEDNGVHLIVRVNRHGAYYDTWYFNRTTGILAGQQEQDANIYRLREKSEMRPIDHFFIYAGQREWAKTDWVKVTHEDHPDGATAAQCAKDHNENSGNGPFRFMVKKETELSPIRDYAKWAEERFSTGEWRKLPFELQHPFHFAHLSNADDAQVAFWASEADAQNDRITTMLPGRYLNAYYADDFTPNQIRDLAVQIDADGVLKLCEDADEIVRVYVALGQACMRYDDHSTCHDGFVWRSGINPTRVYHSPDLNVAYLERKDRIIARALVRPEAKAVGRIYGDIERMTAALEAEGWNFDCRNHSADGYGDGLFNGARLMKVVPERYPHNLTMPYLDFGYGVKLGDEYLTLELNGSDGRRTDGLLWEPGCEPERPAGSPIAPVIRVDDDDDTFECERCGDREDNDSRYTVNGDTWWCENCWDANGVTCTRCDNDFSVGHTVTDGDGERYCDGCADRVLRSCDYCQEQYHVDNLNSVGDGRYAEGDEPDHYNDACNSCVETHGDIVIDRNGHRVDTDTVDYCDHCEGYVPNTHEHEEEMEPAE